MGAGLRFDPSLIRVGRLTDVTNCPLSAQLRKRLRRVGVNTDDVRCAYSPEPIRDALRRGDERFKRFDPAPAPPPDSVGKDYPQGRPRNTCPDIMQGCRLNNAASRGVHNLSFNRKAPSDIHPRISA